MTIGKEDLAAYADGELTGQAREDVRAALEDDAELRADLEQIMALKSRLSDHFDLVLDEAVPDHLIAAAMGATEKPADIVDFPSRRSSRLAALVSYWPQAAAMAASVVVGVVLGGLFLGGSDTDGLVDFSGDSPLARGALAIALTEQLGSETGPDSMTIPISFQDESGQYCRAFSARDKNLAGIACRNGSDWQVRMIVDAAHADTPYRTATSSLPLSVLEQLDTMMAGDALDQDAESAAQARGWSD